MHELDVEQGPRPGRSPRRRQRWFAACLALLATVVLATSANAASPQTLSAAGAYAYDPQVAVDAHGYAYYVWERYDGATYRVQLRRRSPAGTFSAVQTLSAAGQHAYYPQVAVDDDGNAYVAWERHDGTNWRIQLRRRSASGSLSSVQTLSAAGQDANVAQVAVDTRGNAYVVWQRSDGANTRIQLRRRAYTGALGAVKDLSAAGQNAYDAQIVVNPTGHAYVAWRRYDGTFDRIQTRRRSVSGTLSPVQTLSTAGQHANEPQLAVDATGNTYIAWRRWDGASYRVQLLRRSAAGGLGPVKDLSPAGQDAGSPDVAVDADSDAYVVWSRSDATNERVQLRKRSHLGPLGSVQTLSAAGQDASDPQVVVDPQGNATIVWLTDAGNARVQLRRRSAPGTLGSIATLSAAGQDAERQDVAIGKGRVVIVWQRLDGTNWRIQAATLAAS